MSEAQNGGNVMERLTYRDKDGFPMMKKRGGFKQGGVERLAAYEDTRLEPEEVLPKDKADEIALKLMQLADLENFCSYTRLRELAEADKAGRVVVLPCQSGEHVFALLDGQKHVRECEVKYAILDGWLKVLYIEPIGAPENFYSAPFGAFGQTVFLTHEEAKKALEAMKDVCP